VVTRESSRAPFEVEAALAIASPSPGEVAGQIAGLASIGGITLIPAPPQQIRDVHVDTADRALAARQLSLRLRAIGAEEWVTLKGRSRDTSWGAVERPELEKPWSPEALQEVVAALRETGVTVGRTAVPTPDRSAQAASARAGRSAQATLAARGLQPVQIRRTARRRRHAAEPDDHRRLSSVELAIDVVTYQLDRREVRFHEVEIEVLAAAGASIATQISDALMERFAPVLRRWPHGKLATGLAAEGLLAAGRLESLLLSDGALGPAALDAIDTWLGGERR
jgi:inorganic triphosphatase YgiF